MSTLAAMRVVHFEVFAKDAARAIRFYSELFQWNFESDPNHEGYWHIRTGPKDAPGIDGGLTAPYIDGHGVGIGAWVATVQVEDLSPFAEKIAGAGGTIVKQPFEIEGYGRMLHARDPEGNLFGVIEKR